MPNYRALGGAYPVAEHYYLGSEFRRGSLTCFSKRKDHGDATCDHADPD